MLQNKKTTTYISHQDVPNQLEVPDQNGKIFKSGLACQGLEFLDQGRQAGVRSKLHRLVCYLQT